MEKSSTPRTPGRCPGVLARFLPLTALAALSAWLPAAEAAQVAHDVSAGLVNVVQNDTANNETSVTTSTIVSVNDFRVRTPGNSRGDFTIQIGPDFTDDQPNGVLMSCIAENGRNNNEGTGVNYCTSAIDYTRTGASAGGYWVPTFTVYSGLGEYNVNFAAAYFPYSTWLGGFARNSTTVNGGTNDLFTGSPGLELGTHFVGTASGRSLVDLRSLGIDSQTDGILLVTFGKNEANYALSHANDDGTWTLYVHDDAGNGGSYEQDPIAFVFIPKTNTTVISGKVLGDATINLYSGDAPQFNVTATSAGTYTLNIPGHTPRDGVLIISPEGGVSLNADNIVSYRTTATNWIIQSRDLPNNTPGLQSPGTEPAFSFVFVPGPTPGFTVTPTNNLQTTESGGTASFSVVLDAPPIADVTVNVSSSNPAEGIPDVSTLTFTASDWNVPHVVNVTGQDDAVADDSVAYTIVLSPAVSDDTAYSGMDPADVAVVNADNEAGITVFPTSGLVTTEAGGTATFTVALNTAPASSVTVSVASSNPNEGFVTPSTLTFDSGNWNVPQTVTITGVDDFVDDGNVGYSIITSAATSADPAYNGLNPQDVAVVNVDDDTAGMVITPTAGLTVSETGTTTNFTVVLTSQPTANVTVNLVSSDTTEGTVTPSLTFTPLNWNAPQTATITGVDDAINDGTVAYSIVTTISSTDPVYAAINPPDLAVTTADNEAILVLPSGPAIFGIGMPAVGIDGSASLADTNSANYNSGLLTVALTANAAADDLLEIRNTGTDAGQIGVSGANVSFGGTTIGTFSGGVGASPIVVALNAAATPDAVQALMRNVTFRNTNSSPSLATRTAMITLADGKGGTITGSKAVRVGLLRQAVFQEGVDGGYGPYTGESDIELYEANPGTAYPIGHNATAGIWIDWPDSGANNSAHALLRFDNIVGDAPGQIPAGATIVAADLTLNINDQGNASPLYRMLIPWDATNETWDSFSQNGLGGIQNDDFEARSVADSQIGVLAGSANTDTGPATVSVLPDVRAWVNGEANYGWGMPGWQFQANGTGFSPSESPILTNRPKLAVLWLPADTAEASFRDGVNDYAGAFETALHQNNGNGNFSTGLTVFSDGAAFASSDESQVLIRFDDIIGTGANQVPPGSIIHAAVLDLASVGGDAMGDGGRFYAMLQPWDAATSTWNSWGAGIQPNGIEAAATPTLVAGNAERSITVQGGYHAFEVTSDVQAWASGVQTNYGWAILPWLGGSDGWGFNTSQLANDEITRPQLRVYYTAAVANNNNIVLLPPVRTPSEVEVSFTGTVGNTYSVLRAPTPNGPWSTLGTATVTAGGTATYTDSAPPADAAFYRVSYP